MGLDVFVGSLTRYYSGDWELIAQQAAREMGLELQVVRQHHPPDAIRDPDQIRPIVLGWRDSLSASLSEHLQVPLDWNEGADATYSTDKPTWDCYADLTLWAAYSEHPGLRRPSEHMEQWSEDPAYQLVSNPGTKTAYSHLYDVELWLPCDFDFVFKAEDIAENEILIGSSITLARQLKQLNDRTWRAEKLTLQEWRRDGADCGVPLEFGARFAFAIFWELSAYSVEHRLPMRLDY